MEVGAALANDDLAGVDQLTAEALHAEALGVGITAVARGAGALLVCHVVSPSAVCGGVDAGDAQPGVLLAVALARVLTGLVLELVDADLRALLQAEDLCRHRDAGESRRISGDRGAVNQQEGRQRHGIAGLAGHQLDIELVADSHLVLLTSGAHDRVHRFTYLAGLPETR